MTEYIRPCGRNGRAPIGNQNASKRPGYMALREYAGKLGSISRQQLADQLGVSLSTTYRWIPVTMRKGKLVRPAMVMPQSKESISNTERCIILALCYGYSYADAARELDLTEGRCAALVREVKERYRISNREQLGVWAVRAGIL